MFTKKMNIMVDLKERKSDWSATSARIVSLNRQVVVNLVGVYIIGKTTIAKGI